MANDEVMRNLEAEKAVLGALMDEQVALKWADKLELDDFSDADNRRLFTAIATVVTAKRGMSLAHMDAMLSQLYGNIDLMPKLIAEALGVTSQTVYRHIGKQPPELRAAHRRVSAASVPQCEEEIPACLAVANRTIMLRGAHLVYDLDLKKQTLQVISETGSGLELTLDELNDVIAELRCIGRKAENLKLENEMW